jgi:hypothetical protein
LLCRLLTRPGFLSHLRSFNGCDGPEIFPSSTHPICLIGADADNYEQIAGSDPMARKSAAIADLDYLIKRYGSNPAWLRVAGRPVLFIYQRALEALTLDEWREVLSQVRRDNAGGVLFIADSLAREPVAVFDLTAAAPTVSQKAPNGCRRRNCWLGGTPLIRKWLRQRAPVKSLL